MIDAIIAVSAIEKNAEASRAATRAANRLLRGMSSKPEEG
jgi:hypothetical protein